MKIDKFPGLFTNADPHDLPPGASVSQNNAMSMVTGMLTVRKGLQPYTDWAIAPGAAANLIAVYAYRNMFSQLIPLLTIGGDVYIGGSGAAAIETNVDVTRPSVWCKVRSGHLIRVNGSERGSIYNGASVYPLGITAPAAGPTIGMAGGGAASAGDYVCAYRYKDSEGIYSPLSPLTTKTATADQEFNWSVIADSSEARVTEIELWRSTVDQADTLYLIDTIDDGTTTYNGTGGDGGPDQDSDLTLYAAESLDILTFDNQLNARRQVPPPVDLSVCVAFQDRVFYAVPVASTWGTYIANVNNWETSIVGMFAFKQGQVPLEITSVTDNGGGSYTLNTNGVTTYINSAGNLAAVYISSSPSAHNRVVYSETDEPESASAVQNSWIVQENTRDNDRNTALMPYGSALFFLKDRHTYQLTFGRSPRHDGAARMRVGRGCLNQQCWDYYEDTAYLMDSQGPWRMGPQGVDKDFGARVQNYWRDSIIDLDKSTWFFVSVEPNQAVVRYHVVMTADDDTRPTSALCYGIHSGAWWLETYPFELAGSARVEKDGGVRTVVGCAGGMLQLVAEGLGDKATVGAGATSIAWSITTGIIALPLEDRFGRDVYKPIEHGIQVVFNPTSGSNTLSLTLYRDHEATAQSWFGPWSSQGGSVQTGGTAISVQMKAARTPLANSPGFFYAPLTQGSGRKILGQKYVSLKLSGTQLADAIEIFGAEIT